MPPADLGPRPEPKIEPGEPPPGGVDAVDEPEIPPLVPDRSPDINPATEGASTPAAVREGEDTSTEATRGADGEGDGSGAEQRSE